MLLWALGLVSSYAMGGFIHLPLVVAMVMVLFRGPFRDDATRSERNG
jgi:hypothetical protein